MDRDEALGQSRLMDGALILLGVYMAQPFLTARSLDASAKVSIVAFSVAIPPFAALLLVNRHETFHRRRTPSVTVVIARVIASSVPSSGASPDSGT